MGERKSGFNLMLGSLDRLRLSKLAEEREASRGEVIRTLIRVAAKARGAAEVEASHDGKKEREAASDAADETEA